MKVPRDMRALAREARRQGWSIEPRRAGHLTWRSPAGALVISSGWLALGGPPTSCPPTCAGTAWCSHTSGSRWSDDPSPRAPWRCFRAP